MSVSRKPAQDSNPKAKRTNVWLYASSSDINFSNRSAEIKKRALLIGV